MRTLAITVLVFLNTMAVATAQTTVQVSEQDCSQLVRHVASSDATYQPGIDVNANVVAPADLDGPQQIPAPDVISFPLTLDLADRLGIQPVDAVDILVRPIIGVVAITSDGRVTFNGTPLTSDAQHELAQKCQRISTRP